MSRTLIIIVLIIIGLLILLGKPKEKRSPAGYYRDQSRPGFFNSRTILGMIFGGLTYWSIQKFGFWKHTLLSIFILLIFVVLIWWGVSSLFGSRKSQPTLVQNVQASENSQNYHPDTNHSYSRSLNIPSQNSQDQYWEPSATLLLAHVNDMVPAEIPHEGTQYMTLEQAFEYGKKSNQAVIWGGKKVNPYYALRTLKFARDSIHQVAEIARERSELENLEREREERETSFQNRQNASYSNYSGGTNSQNSADTKYRVTLPDGARALMTEREIFEYAKRTNSSVYINGKKIGVDETLRRLNNYENNSQQSQTQNVSLVTDPYSYTYTTTANNYCKVYAPDKSKFYYAANTEEILRILEDNNWADLSPRLADGKYLLYNQTHTLSKEFVNLISKYNFIFAHNNSMNIYTYQK